MIEAAEVQPRRVLPDGRFAGPMPWVIAIMIVFAVLSAALGLAVGRTTAAVEADLAGRVTVQVVEPNPDVRVRARAAIAAELRRSPLVAEVQEVGDSEVRDLLAPWLGSEPLDTDLPVPALIDVTLRTTSNAAMEEVNRIAGSISRQARIDRHADWLGPVAGLLGTLRWLALGLVTLTAAAAAATVVLGARAAMDQHRATIDVMHLMGATDRQIARLFEHRVAQDAISGAALGFVVAAGLLLLIGLSGAAVQAALIMAAPLGLLDWVLLALIPLAGVGLAILAARVTVLRALARTL